MSAPRPVVFRLSEREVAALNAGDIVGNGGHQAFLRRLLSRLQPDGTIEMTDADLGEVLRHGWTYGSGGFQGRIKEAFRRSFRDLLGML